MSDTHSPVLVRMENELKAALQREATLHGRTLTKEINTRLRDSLKPNTTPDIASASKKLPASYSAEHTATAVPLNDNGPAGALSDTDRAMLLVFRAMPVEKQLALLSLFK